MCNLHKYIFFLTLFFCFFTKTAFNHGPFPMQFAISETKIVKEIPQKDRDFAFIIPGKRETYIYRDEEKYYKDYQRSYFAITRKKAGWDSMRNYEILANGCIPYFTDIDHCPPKTLYFLPKKLIKEAMSLEGVSYLKIDHSKFNKEKYYEILNKLLEYTRKHLTTKSIARYLLETVNYSGSGKILFLSNISVEDYMISSSLIGLKELLFDLVIDFPKINHIYKNYLGNISHLYGFGFSYSRIIDDIPVDRTNIEQRIKNKEFELIIYSYIHKGLPFHNLVQKIYKSEKIIYICGEDTHKNHKCEFEYLSNLFLRELQ